MKANKVKPGEYFVLNFNFSAVRRSPDLTKAAQVLADGINGSSPVAINDIQTALTARPDGSYNLLP